ncbi:MAG: CrcB family protein [Pseudomonadota bacterium]
MNGVPALAAIAAVAFGGAAGATVRYGLSVWLHGGSAWPAATLLANLGGCLVLGAVLQAGWAGSGDHLLRLMLVVGFCGGFTTMSTFVFEVDALMRNGQALLAATYFAVSLIGALLSFYLGAALVRLLAR